MSCYKLLYNIYKLGESIYLCKNEKENQFVVEIVLLFIMFKMLRNQHKQPDFTVYAYLRIEFLNKTMQLFFQLETQPHCRCGLCWNLLSSVVLEYVNGVSLIKTQ